ncbi:MAG: hypothetical protein HOD97_07295 [Candidatus Marinimicrobia bacterium]|jgi:lipopolysaccharide export system protein LptA|nr:hypothetical protein [Candidatus Neomarinimicrobiota bacterium]MBT3617622.1 hypothetical protein [Candidatus Neomarinimicrobiota bacterium]MBT3829104.1 hypothetical protein [Candidatus Neomarinimicrobiota bacterium]MBT4281399.1 hypothetical protein [Candidatus Neomarinimicrobiota bacterium]MBT4795363.1 hypothetical protein [Candidatus Neomarinimicrobiota bacterium]
MNLRILSLCFLLGFLFSADNRLRLKRADVLENITLNGEAVQILTGNVIFQKEDMTLRCDHARYHQKVGLGMLVGSVKVVRNNQTLTCDSLHINSPKDILTGYGNTRAWTETYDLKSDTLVYYSKQDSGLALGNVKLIQEGQTIMAEELSYVQSQVTDGVSYSAHKKVIIQDSLRTANCGRAIYNRESEKTQLILNPKIIQEGQTISGKEISLQYNNGELEFVYIPEQAHAIYHNSGYREIKTQEKDSVVIQKEQGDYLDDMTSRVMKAYFVNGSMDSMRLEGMATTLYHNFDDSVYQGKNLASGDTVWMKFQEGNLNQILVSGGARGTYTPDTVSTNIEAPLEYTSNVINYKIPEEETDLHGNANIDYTNVHLSAGFINVLWSTNVLRALPQGYHDTTYIPMKPTLTEDGRSPMEGDTLLYNLESQRGKVIEGRTKIDDGYFQGDEIRNRENDDFYIDESIYSTCDLPVPHFHFESSRMKMISEDKVVARPIVLYISGIPIMGLPLGVFPHQRGRRHSGWIMPGYGESSTRGQYLDGLGYYWAPSDYWGSKFTMSFADRQGITIRLNNAYEKRYAFSGNLNLENRQNFPSGLGQSERDITQLLNNRQSDYVVNWNHNQVLRNDQTFRVNASYYSNGQYNRLTGINPVTRLNQQARSNATYTKNWRKSNNSISINLSSNTDLMVEQKIDPTSAFYSSPIRSGTQMDITSSTFPKIAFRHGQRKLIKHIGGSRKWYHNIAYNYSSNFTNKHRTYYESESYSLDDSTSIYRWITDSDSAGIVQSFNDYVTNHSMGLSAPQKVFQYITLNPNMSLRSVWVNKSYSGHFDTSGVFIKDEIVGFAQRTTGSMGLSASTQFYGLFPIGIGSLKSIRHVMSTSIGYSYTPDFSKPVFGQDLGYFKTITQDSLSQTFDRFSGTMAGGTSSGERQSMNFSLNHSFQAKMKDGDQTKKVNLFTWGMSSGYNFVAETFKLSQLQSSVRSNIAGILNLDLSMKHDFYDFNPQTGARIDRYRVTETGIPYPRLMNMSLSTGFKFSGKRIAIQSSEASGADSITTDGRLDTGIPSSERPSGSGNLWSTTLSIRYSQNRSNPELTQETFWLSTNSNFKLTKNWNVGYSARFDLINRELVSHNFSINRDLHCWTMSITWTPSGYGSGFHLLLHVKSPTLKDLKVEQRGGRFRSQPNW